MSSAYTETFVRATAAGVTVTYTVPAGRRAVVTSIVVVNVGGGPGQDIVTCAGVYIYIGSQASNTTTAQAQRCVAYAGQTITANAGVAGHQITVSGYLLTDP